MTLTDFGHAFFVVPERTHMDSLEGYATYSGAARILNCTYWQVVTWIKTHNVKTAKLYGSQAVLVKLSDLAELQKKN